MIFKTIKRAALRLFVGALLLIGGVIIFQACNSPHFRKDIADVEAEIKGPLYRGVSVKQDAIHGQYLSFNSMDDVKSAINYLEKRTDDQKTSWEQGIKFASLRTAESSYTDATTPIYQYPAGIRQYPNRTMSTILNPSGYVKVAGKIYQDTNIGDMVYVYEGNEKKVYRDANVRDKSTCYRSDGSNATVGNYSGLIPTAKVRGYIDHYTNYWNGAEYLYIYTYYEIQAANGAGGWYPANASNLGIYYTYDILIDGSRNINNGTSSNGQNKSSHWTLAASGWDICIGYVYATHSAGGLTTQTRVEKP